MFVREGKRIADLTPEAEVSLSTSNRHFRHFR